MDLLTLEQQRQALEDNLLKLRQSLKHWQLWEAEYEGLKEELVSAGPNVDADGLNKIATTYGGDLVNEKEILELTGLDKHSTRDAKTIVGLIERRQEYVQRNIETVQRQFFDAEAKQEELAFAAASTHSGAEEAGLPLTEIHEELDDEGNVVSSRLSQPEETTAKVMESLRQAGLSKEDVEGVMKSRSRPTSEELKPAITNTQHIIPVSSSPKLISAEKRSYSDPTQIDVASDGSHDETERPTIRKKAVSFTADTKESTERQRSPSRDGKKSVSFNDKIAVMPAAPPPDPRSVSFSAEVEEIPPDSQGPPTPDVKPLSEEEIEKARALMSPVAEPAGAGPPEAPVAADFTIPEDESPEDAQLRREMLEYHLNEVGNVVAQMDIDDVDTYTDDEDDNLSFHTTSEYPEEDDTPYTTGLSDDSDSEDDMGRSKHSQITPAYRKQMEELQRRLIGNLGPAPQDEDVTDPDLDPKDVRKLVIRDKRNSSSSNGDSESSEKKTAIKKRVSFAEELDVTAPESPPLKAQKIEPEAENDRPVAKTVMERTAPVTASHQPISTTSPHEPGSKVKQSRVLQDPVPSQPTPPDTTPLRATLFERTPAATTGTAAPTLEDADTITARRELAEAYYSKRNDMIRRQGGFKASAEEERAGEEGQLMEEGEDGKVRKVSRFKAARIRGA